MELPVQSDSFPTRPFSEIRALAVAVQVNLARLVEFESRRHGRSSADHPIRIETADGDLARLDALLGVHTLADLDDESLQLRLRETWGRYCAFAWVLSAMVDESFPDFSAADHDVRCNAAVALKRDEVHAEAWKLRHELRVRGWWDPALGGGSADSIPGVADEDHVLARRIECEIFEKCVDECDADEILLALHEHMGILAVLQWVIRPASQWSDPDLREIADRPF